MPTPVTKQMVQNTAKETSMIPHARRWGSMLMWGEGGVSVSMRPKIRDLLVSRYKSQQTTKL
jgi:hypothetical protein